MAPTATSGIIERNGLKIAIQQTGSPGKVRWVVQRAFGQTIGTNGERILRVVIDSSGRVVTAFPAERLLGWRSQ